MDMGRHLLKIVKEATPMLPCAEDLGVVPTGLRDVLASLGILSLKIERWEKDDENNLISPDTFPYLSVSTPAVHDTSTLRGWWEEEDRDRESLCSELEIDDCPTWLTPETAQAVLRRSMSAGSAVRMFQIQDLFALTLDLRTLLPSDERINTPGSTSEVNWSYRIPIPVESLPGHEITHAMKALTGTPDRTMESRPRAEME
jgi:4-alpha-glucanotransferase